MSRTKQALNKLNEKMRKQIDFYKSNYGKEFATNHHVLGYLYGLTDAGVITEIDRRVIFSYVSLGTEVKSYADTDFRTEDSLWQ